MSYTMYKGRGNVRAGKYLRDMSEGKVSRGKCPTLAVMRCLSGWVSVSYVHLLCRKAKDTAKVAMECK